MSDADVIVVGGGIVGAALADGLVRSGARVLMIDGGDADFRAARANFGLVWTQSKGAGMPAYQRWTEESAALWRPFAERLERSTGTRVHLRQNGGLTFCLGEAEYEKRELAVRRLHNQAESGHYDVRMLRRRELEELLPGVRLGRDVVGASFCPGDGDVDPLYLLRALSAAIGANGGRVVRGAPVSAVTRDGAAFVAHTAAGIFRAPRIVLAAGHGSKPLAASLGIDSHISPERGQIIVTERLAPVLPMPASGVRQTAEGTVMIGATKEEVGFDLGTTVAHAATLAKRAVAILPALAGASFVRQWSGLRVMSPDGHPVYAESEQHPGAFLVSCHSGVTLAAVHADALAPALAEGRLPERVSAFHPRRFERDVPKAA